jgi:TnpA family transposase
MREHPIAAHWGRADLASSDMMSLETSRTVRQARADPRRRTASIGMYTHVLDRWGIFYDQPIVLNERQAGAAIEGVVRQNTTKDIAQIAMDTHGYTDFAMGLARVLGLDLCPRLAHLRDRRLHVPRSYEVPPQFAAITDCDVKLQSIADVWDEFVRIAASIRSGKCTAVDALTRFGSSARSQAVYERGVHIGRLFRTIFQIDYFTNVAFRSEIQHVLNRGEAVHDAGLLTFLVNNRSDLIDYQQAHMTGRRVSSASAESVMNHLINRRLTKRQQMRWSMKGAHYLLQTRVELLDGRLETYFAKRFPHFRSPEVARQ